MTKLPHEDLRDLIWRDEIHKTSPAASDVELLFLEFNQGCLNRNEWLACVRAAVLSPDPSDQQVTKEQLAALYLSASGGKSLSRKERENFAKAWIHAADARRVVAEGLGDAAQTHLDGAYILLAANVATKAHRELFESKAKARKECIEEFAKLVQVARPAHGWTDSRDVAKKLGPSLAVIIDKKKQKCGPFFKKSPATLIDEWLADVKGPVYEAYRGKKS